MEKGIFLASARKVCQRRVECSMHCPWYYGRFTWHLVIHPLHLQVFSSEQLPSVSMRNDMSKACFRYHHVVACVENLTGTVNPCIGMQHYTLADGQEFNKGGSMIQWLGHWVFHVVALVSNPVLINLWLDLFLVVLDSTLLRFVKNSQLVASCQLGFLFMFLSLLKVGCL